jgi:XisI protein
MDRLRTYRDLIKQSLNEHAELMRQQPVPGLEIICILDEDRDQYRLLYVGWENGQRRRYTTLHARIRNGEIWIEEEWTEEGLANRLIEGGVPKEAIVLAFQSPVPHTLADYARV